MRNSSKARASAPLDYTAIKHLSRAAIQYDDRKRKSVTLVHKGNIQKFTGRRS
ncbi:hypothetical protein [Candidatus Flexifilum breve]|uniref:hypothetical protein n=1 Tax=Candidatus Flexifilum breve TaxID=3140694 RepID=UPI0031CC4CB1